MPAFKEKLFQIETGWDRAAGIERVHDGERDYDGARPGGHLVDEVAEQNDLGRNGWRILARVKIEEAQVDLDVTVSRMDAAQRQNALASLRQARMMEIEACDLEREICFHRGADVGRTLG